MSGPVGATEPSPALQGRCPQVVTHPVMDQDWLSLSFLHWRYPVAEVQRLLPSGLRVDTFDGDAWVGLVPFRLRLRIPRGPAVPWLGVFPEINVRTYVRGPDGNAGIWFMSLDAPRCLAIAAARLSYRLPYRLAAMHMRCEGTLRRYHSSRRGTHHHGATCAADVVVGERIAANDVSALEHFLTDRWRLYAVMGRGIGSARVEHQPWELHRAVATGVDAGLIVAAGLGAPRDDPLVHACADVHASLTALRRCRP